MKNKKLIAIVLAVAVITTGAMAITMAWLGTNLAGGPSYTQVYPTQPDDTGYEPPYYPYDYVRDLSPEDEEAYPQPPDYLYPYYDYEDDYLYPYRGYEDDYIFTPVFTREPLPEYIIQFIAGVTFHDTTPFGHDYLTYLTVTHVNFYGESVIGHLIVADWLGDEVLDIFQEMYEGNFPIHSVKLIDHFDASDYYSMAANNSHAFNFRYIAGTNVISRHGFGVAIDINPIQNPYIRGYTIWPAAGAEYLDRTYVRPGMIVPGSVAYNAFISRGWIWGGYWTWPRDYHHFERRR